jgi:adenine-specific DNA methylase
MTKPIQPRLIETDFPLRAVSEESVREKNIRHGHISTLHIWWARRPLAASRATALAALLPDDPQRRNEFLRLVREIAPWEVVADKKGGGEELLAKARAHPRGLRRSRTEGAGPLCRRRGHPAGGAAPGLRDLCPGL